MKDILIIAIQALVYTLIIAFIEVLLFNHIYKELMISVFIASYIDLSVKRLKKK